MPVIISSSLLAAILADARQGEEERCGLLLGDETAILQFRPCANIHPDPIRHFELDPAALIAACREARGGGPLVTGHYHSHPGGEPLPSPTDATSAAADGRLWLIVGAHDHALWRSVERGAVHGRFDPVGLIESEGARLASHPSRP